MSKRKSKQRRTSRSFVSQPEALESRVLLTGDTFSEWQNPVNRFDVNQDSHVSAKDVLFLKQVLNNEGAHALQPRASAEPTDSNSQPQLMLDTNADGFVTAKDLLDVVQVLNAGQGEGEEFRLRVDVTNAAGDVTSEVNVGDTFTLNAYVQDLRGVDAQGVFAAFLDVTYDSSIVSIPQGTSIVHVEPFDDGKFGLLAEPGVIDEAGGFDQSGSGDGTESLLFQIAFQADAVGVMTFQPNPADDLPLREFLANDSTDAIDPANILYDGVELTVVDPALDLAGFAKALDAAGVEFWSTRQANVDAVSQRDLFEDAESFLPFNESFDSNGDLNTAANEQNVTEVNTWIFPDTTRATGVLSLEELSTRSGVAIPNNTGPTLKQVAANDALALEFNSPLNLRLDAYDASNGPLTYTVTAENSSLVESTVISGNRGWELEIEGYGKMVFEFFEGRAPRATNQFITLTESGFYDGLTLHRILEGFVIQGGDPLGNGTGGSDLPDFDDEFDVDLQHNQIGVLSMAKSGDDTNNSQFFVTDDTTRHLDFNHTIFGQLIEGFDVLDAVSAVDVSQAAATRGRPDVPVIIKSARVIDDQENAVVLLRALGDSGTTNVTVTATDQFGNSDSNTFAVTLEPDAENAPPFLNDIPELIAPAGETFQFQLSHVDLENDAVVYSTDPFNANSQFASVSEDGLVTVDIPDTLNDGDTFSIGVRVAASATSARDEQLVNILIGSDPMAVDDTFTIDEDSGPHTFNVLDNDTGSGTLTITDVSVPSDGGTAIIDNGNIIYTPSADFPIRSTTPLDSTFTYTITGTNNQTSTATVTVTVNPVNDPPTANDDSFPADFDQVNDEALIRRLREDEMDAVRLFVAGNDSVDPDEEIPGIISLISETGATLTIESVGTAVDYIPGANVFGTDTFSYTFADPGGLSDTANVTVIIAQVNDVPETTADAVSVISGVSQMIAVADLLANDSAGPLEDAVQTLSISSFTQPANGTLTRNTDGSLEYLANPGFSGTDSFEYTATDDGITEDYDETTDAFVGSADPLSATGTVTVTVTPGTPIAVDDTYTIVASDSPVAQSLDVLANDDLTLSPKVTAVGDAVSGTVEIINDGADVAYTPNAGFTGSDSFTYTITDSAGTEASATVSLNVQVENMAPEALDDSFVVQSDGTAQSLDVLANDTFETGETNRVIGFLDQPDNGTVSISASGDAVLYTPNAGFVGTDSFVYQIDDGNGGMDAAQVSLTVESTNQNPVGVDDEFVLNDFSEQELLVLENDTTESGETLTIDAIVTPPSSGVARIASDGVSIFYEPIDDQVTVDSFVYQIQDSNGGVDTATAMIRINVDPVAEDDTITVTGVQTLDVLANDTTENGETLTVAAITVTPAQGTAEISADGASILFTPTSGATGADTLTYEVSDGNGGTDTASVALTLEVIDLDPVANDDVISVTPFGEQALDVLSNDEGEVGETLTITQIGGSPAGTVSINSEGSGLLYTPAPDSVGTTDTFTYTIDDGAGQTAEATVTLDISELSNSFFAGVVFNDTDRNGQQGANEPGIGGVTVVLEGTDLDGETVRQETKSALDGAYRFESILPGDYKVSEMQPPLLTSGANVFGLTVTQEDEFDFQVSEQLIDSDNNTFGEQGLTLRFAMLDTISSSRDPGVFVVLDGDELAWAENRGGWDDVTSLVFSRDGDQLSIESSAGNGILSMTDRGVVKLIGRSGDFTILRIRGTSDAVLSAAAVDEVLAT